MRDGYAVGCPHFPRGSVWFGFQIFSLTAIVLIAMAVFALRPSGNEISANGATRLIVEDSKIGPYIIRVGILPGSPKVGLLHLSVLVQDASRTATVTDATVLLTATGPQPEGGTVQVQAFNTPQSPQLYEGNVPLVTLGRWILTIDINSPLGRGSLDVPLRVTDSGGLNLLFVIAGATAVLVIGSLTWSRKNRNRHSSPKRN